MTRRILLNAFDMACVGHQSAGLWRHPSDEGHRYTDLDHWTSLARMLEDGGFDALFLADVLGVYDVYGGSRDAAVRAAAQVPLADPLLLVPAMAGVTSRLGFGVTVSVAYEHPYALARRFTTLDHLTKGRVAWNVVTSYLDSAARNLGRSGQIPHDERYELAEEFLEVCYKLWEGSWTDDAVVRDAERGVFAEPSRVRDIGHHGQWFDVPGAFLSEPSPQRTPVIFQAGASARGARFAGTHAEAVFVSGPSPAVVRRSVDAIRAEAERAGRDPRSVRVFAMLTAIAGESDDAAHATLREYLALTDPRAALALFGGWSGVDLSGAGPEQKLEYVQTESTRSALAAFTGPDRDWTVGELAEFITVGGRGPVVVGSGATVADELERWADEADLDGFNLAYAVTPGTMRDVVTHVVPELRRRGRMPAAAEAGGPTLRERYGTGDGARLAEDHPGAGHRKL